MTEMHKIKHKVNLDELSGDFGKVVTETDSVPVAATDEAIEKAYPHWEPDSVTTSGLSRNRTYRQLIITEVTNDKEWMHRNMDLADIGKRLSQLMSYLAIFAVGIVGLVGIIWILSAT